MEHIYLNESFGEENFFNFEDVYSLVVEKYPTNSTFVEVGSWKGRSSAYMAVEIANSGKNIDFVCVDTFLGSQFHHDGNWPDLDKLYDIFKQNMTPVSKYYRDLKMTSTEAAKLFEDESIDFVYIDACHEYESVKSDIHSWMPKIKKGGIIAGHDYNPTFPGVIQAVHEEFGENNISIRNRSWVYNV
jgi:hypothetical protein